MTSSYRTLSERKIFELKESRSKFIAVAVNVQSAAVAMKTYAEVRKEFYDAAHFPYAYRTGTSGETFRFSDDGEPSGSGGRPIFDAIVKHSLTDTLVVVVRYFGGIKLGVGGLKRAFFEAADKCLSQADVKTVYLTQLLDLVFEYKFIGPIMRIIEESNSRIITNNSDESCRIAVEVRLSDVEEFSKKLISITNASIKIS